jgi:hypothetical protein
MNKQELKKAIEKSDMETETKAELIEIVELLDFEKTRAREANEQIESDTMNELLRFLEGKFTPETVKIVDKSKLPKLSTIQAWFVIYALQEHFNILPKKFELCDDCGRIFDSEIEGIHTDDKVMFEEGEIAFGLSIEDLGKILCGYCEDVHRIREYAKDDGKEE